MALLRPAMRYAFVWHLRNAENTAAVKGLPVFMTVVHTKNSSSTLSHSVSNPVRRIRPMPENQSPIWWRQLVNPLQ